MSNATNPAQSIHLQGIGRHIAKPGQEIQVGDVLVWNYGETSIVLAVLKETKAFITFQTQTRNGKVWERRCKKTSLFAWSPRLTEKCANGETYVNATNPAQSIHLQGIGRHIERVYSDPSAAHECATRLKSDGAYRVIIDPERGRYVVTAWFRDASAAPTKS